MVVAFSLALLNAGSNSAASMAMMAITTSSSIKVKAKYRTSAVRDFFDTIIRLGVWPRTRFDSNYLIIPFQGGKHQMPLIIFQPLHLCSQRAAASFKTREFGISFGQLAQVRNYFLDCTSHVLHVGFIAD